LSNVTSYQKIDLYVHEKRARKLYLLSDLLYVPTHCRCKGLSLRLITLSDTLGRTPVGMVSARRRDLQRITYNIHKTSMPTAVFKPAIPTSQRPQTCASEREATRTGRKWNLIYLKFGFSLFSGMGNFGPKGPERKTPRVNTESPMPKTIKLLSRFVDLARGARYGHDMHVTY